jgi:hypothetical protein
MQSSLQICAAPILLPASPHTNANTQPRVLSDSRRVDRQTNGERGIRTPEPVARLRDFQSRSFSRSDISPELAFPTPPRTHQISHIRYLFDWIGSRVYASDSPVSLPGSPDLGNRTSGTKMTVSQARGSVFGVFQSVFQRMFQQEGCDDQSHCRASQHIGDVVRI